MLKAQMNFQPLPHRQNSLS